MLPQNDSLDISLFLPGYSDVPITKWTHWSKWTNPWSRYVTSAEPLRPHTHTLNLFSATAPPISPPWDGGKRRGCESVCEHTHNSQPGCGCACVFGLGFAVSRCLSDGHWAHREGGAGAPTSRLGQRENTHTIQRCCMRNQCDFGTLHNINLF